LAGQAVTQVMPLAYFTVGVVGHEATQVEPSAYLLLEHVVQTVALVHVKQDESKVEQAKQFVVPG